MIFGNRGAIVIGFLIYTGLSGNCGVAVCVKGLKGSGVGKSEKGRDLFSHYGDRRTLFFFSVFSVFGGNNVRSVTGCAGWQDRSL